MITLGVVSSSAVSLFFETKTLIGLGFASAGIIGTACNVTSPNVFSHPFLTFCVFYCCFCDTMPDKDVCFGHRFEVYSITATRVRGEGVGVREGSEGWSQSSVTSREE